MQKPEIQISEEFNNYIEEKVENVEWATGKPVYIGDDAVIELENRRKAMIKNGIIMLALQYSFNENGQAILSDMEFEMLVQYHKLCVLEIVRNQAVDGWRFNNDMASKREGIKREMYRGIWKRYMSYSRACDTMITEVKEKIESIKKGESIPYQRKVEDLQVKAMVIPDATVVSSHATNSHMKKKRFLPFAKRS